MNIPRLRLLHLLDVNSHGYCCFLFLRVVVWYCHKIQIPKSRDDPSHQDASTDAIGPQLPITRPGCAHGVVALHGVTPSCCRSGASQLATSIGGCYKGPGPWRWWCPPWRITNESMAHLVPVGDIN